MQIDLLVKFQDYCASLVVEAGMLTRMSWTETGRVSTFIHKILGAKSKRYCPVLYPKGGFWRGAV